MPRKVMSPQRLWRYWLAFSLVAIVIFTMLPANNVGAVLYFDALGVLSSVVIIISVRIHRPTMARVWYLIATGQLMFVTGDLVFGWSAMLYTDVPFPSPADAIFLSIYPILGASAYLLIRSRTSGRDRAGLLDASIISTGLGLLSWTFLISPIVNDTSMSVPARIVGMAYPVGDMVLLLMIVRLLTGPGGRTASFRLLISAQIMLLVADIGFMVSTMYDGYSVIVDVCWLLAYAGVGAAALHPSMRSLSEVCPGRSERLTPGRLILLATMSLLAPGLLFAQGLNDASNVDWAGLGIGSVMLFLLVLARMSGLVAQVQDQATQLAALAHNDALTGVANRRAWDLELAREMALARRAGTSISVAILDLDYFKKFNDQHGHQAGDRLLTQSAALWRAQLREHDFIARYGGEEFGIIVPGLTGAAAAAIVERLRAATPDGQTFSAGVATWDGTETPQRLVGRADEALYDAKRTGRDRVRLAPSVPPVTEGEREPQSTLSLMHATTSS